MELKTEILGRADDLQRMMQLSHFTIVHTFQEVHECDPDVYADTTALWEYRHADVTWYMRKMATAGALLDNVIAHEMVHILLSPMSQHIPKKYTEQEEFTVESIARALLGVRDGQH